MSKQSKIIVVILASLLIGWGGQTRAALFGQPRELKSVLDSFSLSTWLWGPKSYNLFCVEHLDQCQAEKAALFGLPKALKPQLDRIQLDTPALGPMAHTMFCLKYPKDCEVRKIAFRGHQFELTQNRWRELVEVNAKVNRSIRPERNVLGLAGEKWIIAPASGDCNDYAVTKRHELLTHGWPSRTLLLAEVVTHWGEHHLVLVARTGAGDFVLDNLSVNIRPWSKAPYRWVRVQSPRDPKYWFTARSQNV